MSSMRKNNLLVKNTGMSLNDRYENNFHDGHQCIVIILINFCLLHRFTQIQQKSKTIGEDEIVRKHRVLSFGVERRPKVTSSLLMDQVCLK